MSNELSGDSVKRLIEVTPGTWHTVVALSEVNILLECKKGPFQPAAAKLNAKLISVSDTSEIKNGILVTGLPRLTDFSENALKQMIKDMQDWKKIRMIGSAAMSACYVASGKADLYKEKATFLWDIAAGAAIVEAAGGVAILENDKDGYLVDVTLTNTKLINN